MAAVSWDGDGQPRSTLYPDIYRSHGPDGDHGLAQARHVFLQGCRLLGDLALWHQRSDWCVLENGFGLGLNFLATWMAWRADPKRPQRLHHVGIEAHPVSAQDLLRSSQPWPELHELAQQLAASWWGLLPGVHRFSFEGGQVTLDLVVGDAELALSQLDLQADSVYLDGFSPRVNPAMWDTPVLTQLRRLSRPGARWASWCVTGDITRRIADLGLQVEKRRGLPPKRSCLVATCPDTIAVTATGHIYSDPVWVLGSGLAGASVARALAERGQRVRLIDAVGPAAGASGLPAGLCAAHTSGDDNALSRLTRMGLRHTLARLSALTPGQDWAPSGLDERMLGPKAKRQPPDDAALARGWLPQPTGWQPWREDWWQTREGGWHQPHAAWLRPQPLIHHLIDHPAIETAWGWSVQSLRHGSSGWALTDERQRHMSGAAGVVVALGPHSSRVCAGLAPELPMQAVRGQVSLGPVPTPCPPAWPLRPRNGDGSVLPCVPIDGQPRWLVGSSFDRSSDQPTRNPEDQQLNAGRWQRLAPESFGDLPDPEQWQAWAGVRATVRDRLPWVGPLDPAHAPGLWVLAGLGARGLTLSALCGEWLACQITGTPSAMPRPLGLALHSLRTRQT